MNFATKYRNELGLLAAIFGVIVFTLFFDQAYIEQPALNITNILHQASLLGIFSLGAAIVIIAGGIDLSSGSVIVFSGSVCGLVMMAFGPPTEMGAPDTTDLGWGAISVALAAAIVAGVLIGTLHTWLITVIKLPPFVATLASLVGLRSFCKVLNPAVSNALGSEATVVHTDSVQFEHLSQWWVALLVFLTLSAICYVLMNHTVWGRHIYALGGNEEAATLSGIRTDRIKWLASHRHRFDQQGRA